MGLRIFMHGYDEKFNPIIRIECFATGFIGFYLYKTYQTATLAEYGHPQSVSLAKHAPAAESFENFITIRDTLMQHPRENFKTLYRSPKFEPNPDTLSRPILRLMQKKYPLYKLPASIYYADPDQTPVPQPDYLETITRAPEYAAGGTSATGATSDPTRRIELGGHTHAYLPKGFPFNFEESTEPVDITSPATREVADWHGHIRADIVELSKKLNLPHQPVLAYLRELWWRTYDEDTRNKSEVMRIMTDPMAVFASPPAENAQKIDPLKSETL
jgi:hypothetical protein